MSARRTALRDAARYLRHQGSLRMIQHGPHDPRGAALWDAGCAIDPDDVNALGVKWERPSAKTAAGYALMASPLLAMFIYIWVLHGWLFAFSVFGMAAGMFLVVLLGVTWTTP